MTELNQFFQFLHALIVDDDKLLVGWGIHIELKTLAYEDILHPHGHLDSMLRKLHIQVVCEQSVKLQADQGTLGDDGSVLLLDGEEMLMRLTVGEDDGFAAKGTNLRTTDVEDVTVTSQIG